MSVSRNVVRLFATCVASGALVGVAALPALANESGHDRDLGSDYSHSYRHDGLRSGYLYLGDRDRDRGWDNGYGRDWGRGWDNGYDRDWDHGKKHHHKKKHHKHHHRHHRYNQGWDAWYGGNRHYGRDMDDC
ncbi:hypothetical protein ACWDA7_30825 [Streptomyces sp. NPDC001156]